MESKKEIESFAKQIANEDISKEELTKGICNLCSKIRNKPKCM